MLYLNDFVTDRKEAVKEGKKMTENERIIIREGFGCSGIVLFKKDIGLYPIPKNAKKINKNLYINEYEEEGTVVTDFYLLD